jgi:NADH dehydrogenase
MTQSGLHVVTGAFGYSGKYIARRLLARGERVATLTNSPDRPHDFEGLVAVHRLQFQDVDALARSMAGARVLYNTYWVRFDPLLFDQSTAVENTLALFEAARRSGVERIVHISITNPSLSSPLPYFAGKARLEAALAQSGVAHSILRPAVLFGPEDILINNIAWARRTFPLFAIFADGSYRLRPIHVDDLAALAVEQGTGTANAIVNAVGPESFSYRDLVVAISRAIGKPRPIVSIPPWLRLLLGKTIGACMRDVFITREEIAGLMANLLDTPGPPTGQVRFAEWARANAQSLGRSYASELRRRRDRSASYLATTAGMRLPRSTVGC